MNSSSRDHDQSTIDGQGNPPLAASGVVDMWRLSPAERLLVLAQCQESQAAIGAFIREHVPSASIDDGGTVYVNGSFHEGKALYYVARQYSRGERYFVVRSGSNYFVGWAGPVSFNDAILFHDEKYGAEPAKVYGGNEVWSLSDFRASSEKHHAALKLELEAAISDGTGRDPSPLVTSDAVPGRPK